MSPTSCSPPASSVETNDELAEHAASWSLATHLAASSLPLATSPRALATASFSLADSLARHRRFANFDREPSHTKTTTHPYPPTRRPCHCPHGKMEYRRMSAYFYYLAAQLHFLLTTTQACVRKYSDKVGLNAADHYRCQDPEKLGQIFHMDRKYFPYLTCDHFPHNWATAEMVKGYLTGARKELRWVAKADLEAAEAGGECKDEVIDEDVDEDKGEEEEDEEDKEELNDEEVNGNKDDKDEDDDVDHKEEPHTKRRITKKRPQREHDSHLEHTAKWR